MIKCPPIWESHTAAASNSVNQMPNAAPQFADIYGIDPVIILGGDSHNALRRHAIVAVGTEYVRGLGRSTTERPKSHLESPVDLDCKLDRPGVFSERWLHSIPTQHFADPKLCSYFGTLKPEAAEALRQYWESL